MIFVVYLDMWLIMCQMVFVSRDWGNECNLNIINVKYL